MYKNVHEVIEAFNEFLDETHPGVEILGIHYNSSEILKAVDPVTYEQELLNFMDSLAQDGLLPPDWEEWEIPDFT